MQSRHILLGTNSRIIPKRKAPKAPTPLVSVSTVNAMKAKNAISTIIQIGEVTAKIANDVETVHLLRLYPNTHRIRAVIAAVCEISFTGETLNGIVRFPCSSKRRKKCLGTNTAAIKVGSGRKGRILPRTSDVSLSHQGERQPKNRRRQRRIFRIERNTSEA
jgi:hypothetical protein